MKKRGTKKTLAKGVTKGLGKGNSNPSNQAKIKAKNESNIGDYKGEISTSITYERNLKKGLEIRKDKALAKRTERFKSFLQEYARLRAMAKEDKSINQKAIIHQLKAKIKLSRREFFEFREILKGRRNIKREKVLDQIKKVAEADTLRRKAANAMQKHNKSKAIAKPIENENVIEIVNKDKGVDDLQNKTGTLPRLSHEHVLEIAKIIESEILRPIRAKLSEKSERIKEGRKRGSIKGGNTNRKNWENFI